MSETKRTSTKAKAASATPKSNSKKSSASGAQAPAMFGFKAGRLAAPSIEVGDAAPSGHDIAVVGIYKGGELSPAAKRADTDTKGLIEAACKADAHLGDAGSTRVVFNNGKAGTAIYVLAGLGDRDNLSTKALKKACAAAVSAVKGLKAGKVFFSLNQEVPNGSTAEHASHLATLSLVEGHYSFSACKKSESDIELSHFELASTKSTQSDVQRGLTTGLAMGLGMNLTKDLGNLPGNICTPAYLAETTKDLAKQYKGLDVDVLDVKKMEALGMFSLLSVGKGSSEPPKLIVAKYNGAKNTKDAPVVLVGKGITFDTGGISLKPGLNMDEMKYDMCGAASVLGTLKMVLELKLPINLIVVVPTAENMPAGNASKPGDIVVSMSGQTIEILNTDAEGRLILCDALTYVERFKPAAVVDVATLTGACVVALGHINSGLFSPQDDLAQALLTAGQQAQDPAWRMPLDEEYHEQLKSNFADMANIGGPPAGSVTAACFLQKYTKAYDWAHLDIAGTAWHSGKAKGASGRPVPLLGQFLLNRVAKG